MKHSTAVPLLALATLAFQATAAIVDYASGEPISSSIYYQYHTKWLTTTCYHTITKTKDCSYDGGDLIGDYETVSPHVYPGQDYNSEYTTVYETVYDTAYLYPSEIAHSYGTVLPYPSKSVCDPKTVYSTVYPESSDTIDHTLTASGIHETVSGSPVYHTADFTIMETVTATPSGGSGPICIPGGPRFTVIVNPGFEDSSWPGAWFTSGPVDRVTTGGDTSNGSAWFARFTPEGESTLEQAVIVPGSGDFGLSFKFRVRGSNPSFFQYTMVVSLGSYVSQTVNIPALSEWTDFYLDLPDFSSPSECVPVILSVKVIFRGFNDGTAALDVDAFSLWARRVRLSTVT